MKTNKIMLSLAVAAVVTGIVSYGVQAKMATIHKDQMEIKVQGSINEDVASLPQYNLVSASVLENENNSLHAQNNVEDEKLVININDDTILVDAATKLPVNFSDITKDTKILSYNSQAKTFSIPAMTNAKAVIINSDENSVSPVFFTVDTVTKNSDGSITVTDKDKSYEVTLNKETSVSPYLTRNIVTLDDVKSGDSLVVWEKVNENAIMTLELPKKMEAESCILRAEN